MARRQRIQVVSLPPALLAIRAESQRVGWPERFATDLDHDATAIGKMLTREPFTWCLRADGTHVGRAVLPQPWIRKQTMLTMTAVAEAFDGRECRFYVWDSCALQPMHSAAAADERLRDLVEKRYMVKTERSSTLVPGEVADRRAGEDLASQWAHRYGEPFVVVDTWEGK